MDNQMDPRRWEKTWKLHQDEVGLLKGIQDREFTLKLIGDKDREKEYQALIRERCAKPHTHHVRLYGEKICRGEREQLILFLIPDANKKDTGDGTVVDLVQVVCRTEGPFTYVDEKPDDTGAERQDGTAHGNPK